jgi:hypothetical protein
VFLLYIPIKNFDFKYCSTVEHLWSIFGASTEQEWRRMRLCFHISNFLVCGKKNAARIIYAAKKYKISMLIDKKLLESTSV